MTRRTRNRVDFTGIEPADAPVFTPSVRSFTLRSLDGRSCEVDLAHLPWESVPTLCAPLFDAAERDAKRRTYNDHTRLANHKTRVKLVLDVLVKTCLASGVTQPDGISPVIIDAIQRGLHTAYAPGSVKNMMSDVVAILRAAGVERDASMAARLRTPYSLILAGGANPTAKPREPYTKEQMRTVLAHLRKEVRRSHERLTAGAEALLAVGTDPRFDSTSRSGGWRSAANIAWELARHGPLKTAEVERRSRLTIRTIHLWAGTLNQLHHQLFPAPEDLYAAYWLLCALTGIESRAAAVLTLDQVQGGIAVYLKPRGGKTAEVRALSPEAQQIVQMVIEMTARARRFASAEDQEHLWLSHIVSGVNFGVGRAAFVHFRRYNGKHGLRDERGHPINITPARLRTTYLTAKKQTVPHPDPSHTADVDFLHYTNNKANASLLDAVAEKGIETARRSAHSAVVANPREATQDGMYMLPVLPPPSQDTRVGACTDPTASPFTRHGEICGTDPWMCFACPNAVVGERHLPNLLAWRHWLEGEHQRMSDEDWDAQWGEVHSILSQELLPGFSDEQIAGAEDKARQIDPTLWMPARAVPDQLTSSAGGR